MKYFLLLTETGLDFIALVLGVLLIIKRHDNRMRLALGVLVSALALIFLVDNVRWLFVYHTVSSDLPARNELLLLHRMVKWVVLAYVASLFPLSSLRPGYLTSLRLTVLSIPVGMVTIVAVCYWLFNGTITPLDSLHAIIQHIGLLDVRLRLILFVFTVIIPCCYFLIPLFTGGIIGSRKATPFMNFYIFSALFILAYYIAFTLFGNDFIFFTYGIVVIAFSLCFSVMFLLYEDPLSVHEKQIKASPPNEESMEEILYSRINVYLNDYRPFIRPDYSLAELAKDMSTRQSLVIAAIKDGGFSGYREFINYVRIEHFKQLAHAGHDSSVKELMYKCGFRSRTTFYRLFSNYESVTPSEYIEQLYQA